MLRALVVVALLAGTARAEDSVPDLIAKAADPAPKVRLAAVRSLGNRYDAAERFAVLEKAATSDPDPEVRLVALRAVAPSFLWGKEPRWKALRIKLMTDADPKVRYEAVAQQRPATPDVFAAHFALLRSEKDPSVLDILILSLHDAKAPGLVEALVPMIETKAIQHRVISTLGFSHDPKAVAPLLEAVKRELPGSPDALAETGDPRAVEVLAGVLEKSTNQELRGEAVGAVRSIPHGRFAAPLLAMWSKLSKADKALSTKPQEDPMETLDDLGHSITAALVAISEVDQAPCDAAKTATAEIKAYLKKVLPAKCGGAVLSEAVQQIVKAQIAPDAKLDAVYTADAAFSLAGGTDAPLVGRDKVAALLGGAKKASQPWVTLSADNQSAWVAMIVNVKGAEWRVTELAVSTASGWRIVGGLASVGQDNKAVNTAAKAGTLKLAALPAGKADAGLSAAFTALTTGPFDATAAAREELLAYGSGPGERTTEGPPLARAWKGSWTKRVAVEGPLVARLAPSGTTGFVIANVSLAKTGYKVPFRLMMMFDKSPSWSVVQVHFATVAP